MPKARAKASRSTKRKTKINKRRNPRLGLYLLAGIATVLIMWGLIREPIPAPKVLEQMVVQEIQERTTKPVKSKINDQATTTRTSTKKQDSSTIEQSKYNHPTPVKESPTKKSVMETPKKGESELDLVVRNASLKLGVPESSLRRSQKDALVRFQIPIDRSKMDLTYANMIYKGEMELAGAAFVKGSDSRTKQTISFKHKNLNETYELNLYYDTSVYKSKVNPQTITIVVDDFGAIGGSLLDGFFSLDKEICFAIFPNEANSVSTMERASLQGRNTIIHVPMEPIGYPRVNPGKNAILVQHSEDRIDKILSQFISDMPRCIGINNHMGSLATSDVDVMQAVMNTLKKHDKLFLDSRTTNVSVAYQTAQKKHIKAFRNDIFLDSPNISQSTMEAKLNRIIELSGHQQHVIAITHCHSMDKLEYLRTFIQRLKKAGFSLIPLSEIGERNIPEIL